MLSNRCASTYSVVGKAHFSQFVRVVEIAAIEYDRRVQYIQNQLEVGGSVQFNT